VDDINQPLVNRATQSAFEPGSTVKPLMALGAMADGVITPQSTIECNGYLVLDGHRYQIGRCWTASEFHSTHHQIPPTDPLPPGGLTVSDAIERSCNVFFETVADHMKMDRQRYWYDRFGLGRPTGIGLPETAGRIPNPAHTPGYMLREKTWFAGIGQGDIAATPLQMANAVATIARGGVWMRPTIIEGAPTDHVELGVTSDALDAVKRGMVAVVNKRAGTGSLHLDGHFEELEHIVVAGKTGTAQAPALTIPERDDSGQIVKENGREKRIPVDPDDPSVASWYISSSPDQTHYAHHWFIGYAPADHPQIAFAVFAEYGGSGGPVANLIARDVLAACVKCGYLSTN
jgi:penicillin-binding protein 2